MSELPSWCRVGAKVVWLGYEPEIEPQVNPAVIRLTPGGVYSIRETYEPLFVIDDYERFGVRVVGVVNTMRDPLGGEICYPLHRFRPLVDPKSEQEDIALFAHHLRAPAKTLEGTP